MKKITVSPNAVVYDLPLLVAIQEGFMADEGLDVELPHRSQTDNSDPNAFLRQKESMFEESASQFYNACEWGCIIRTFDSERSGRIIAKRSAVSDAAITVLGDSEIHRPEDLPGRPIAISQNSGIYYMAYKMLEGFMPRDQINLVHLGAGRDRYTALFDRSVDAAILVEPYLSLAEKHGARAIAEAYFVGEEVTGNNVDDETVAGYLRALGRAAEKLTEDPRKYVHLLIEGEELTGEISPDEVRVDRLRYVKPEPYTQSEFESSYRWMLERGMITEGARYEDLVATVSP